MSTVTVTPVKGHHFNRGVSAIRRFGGTYNPATKSREYVRLADAAQPVTTATRPTYRSARYCDCASGQYGGACTCC